MAQHMTDSLPEELTLGQLATLLRVSRVSAGAAILMGELPRRRRGLRVVVPTADLLTSFGVPVNQSEDEHDDDG